MVEEESIEKKVVCGKCGGANFNALVAKTPEVVVINFACVKCKHESKIGIRRLQPQEAKAEQRQSPGFFERLTGAFGKRKSSSEAEEDQGDWEENLDALLEESK